MWLGSIDTKLQMVTKCSAKVYNRLQSSFVSLAWPWSGRSPPKGTSGSGGTLDWGPMWQGSQSLLPPHIWPTQSLTGWYLVAWLVGWPIAAGKLAGWLTAYHTKCQPDPPSMQWHLVTMCVTYIGHIYLWSHWLQSDVPLPSRDMYLHWQNSISAGDSMYAWTQVL